MTLSLVRDVIALYLDSRPGILSDTAWAEARRILDLFVKETADIALGDAIPLTIVKWLGAHPEWESDWTRARAVRTVQRPFNWAVKVGAIHRNPFAGYSVPAGCAGRAMTDEEFDRAMAQAAKPFQELLTFLRYTGARPCEARALVWEQINPDLGTATFRIHKTHRTRKDRAPRVIVLNQCAIDLLVAMLEGGATGEGTVFLNCHGKPWTRNAVSFQWLRLRRRAGLPADCKPYGLRHRFGTVAAEAGIDIKAISELMGHTTTRMTEHYIHVAGKVKYLRGVLGKVDGL